MKRNCGLRIADCGLNKAIIHTSLGWMGVAASDKGVCRIVLPRKERKTVQKELSNAECPLTPSLSREGRGGMMMNKAVKILQEYFSGKRVLFDLPVDLRSFTAFQRAVWRAASVIPFGETRTYGWIATRIKRPNAARAVGQAMGANPVPVIIP